MENTAIRKIIEDLSHSLQTRDYDKFISYFVETANFETPFSIAGGHKITGKENITKHFESVRQSPLSKIIQIESVSTKAYFSDDEKTITVEYFTKGKSISTGEAFEIQSSIAIITFNEDNKIISYKDFPNTLGLAKKAGVLSQLAETWVKQ